MTTLGTILAVVFGWPEIIGLLVVVLVMFGTGRLPPDFGDLFLNGMRRGFREFQNATREVSDDLTPGMKRPVADALTTTNQTAEDTSQPAPQDQSPLAGQFTLWVAEGFGVGRIPVAPGTFGSLLGLLWFALLLWPGDLTIFVTFMWLSVIASVWFCGRAEIILKRRDPPSVVLDEIIAVPVCFTAWVVLAYAQSGALPTVSYFFVQNWPGALGVFTLFRLFDILKPGFVRRSQSLPGGWGVTVDDLLAAVCVNAVVLVVFAR